MNDSTYIQDRQDIEIVYILTNPAMPDLIKIGRTDGGPNRDDLIRRVKQLTTTGVPVSFECFYAAQLPKSLGVEKMMHKAFVSEHYSKEFYTTKPHEAKAFLETVLAATNLSMEETLNVISIDYEDTIIDDDDRQAHIKADSIEMSNPNSTTGETHIWFIRNSQRFMVQAPDSSRKSFSTVIDRDKAWSDAVTYRNKKYELESEVTMPPFPQKVAQLLDN